MGGVETQRTVCPYMYSALNHKWQLGPVVPRYCPQRALKHSPLAAPALPYSCVDPNGPRSPETIGLTGVAGMRCHRVLESHLLLGEWDIFTVGFRFLWEKRTTFSREFLEFGRQRSAGMSRGAWCLLPVVTRGAATSHINNLALVDHPGQMNS